MKLKYLVFILISLLITSFMLDKSVDNVAGNTIKGSVPEEAGPEPEVYFCPREDCNKALFDFISSAEQSIHCALFDLDLEDIIMLLIDRSAKIDVKVVVDNDYYDELKDKSFIRKDTSSQFTHNKFCVIDRSKVSTGSFNPTERGAFFNNNNLIIIASRYLADNYEAEFKELWGGSFGKGENVRYPKIYFNDKRIENYFCPEDMCSDKIIDEIRKADQSIYFMTFSFTHPYIATELVLKLRQGIDVKGVFEKRGSGSEYSSFSLLEYQGAGLRKDINPYVMHHKVFIIDNMTVITGSFNPSKNADHSNDENILMIQDESIAQEYLEEFSVLYDSSG